GPTVVMVGSVELAAVALKSADDRHWVEPAEIVKIVERARARGGVAGWHRRTAFIARGAAADYHCANRPERAERSDFELGLVESAHRYLLLVSRESDCLAEGRS